MTLANDDGPSNGGSEALRVACRYWPEDVRRAVELDRLIRAALQPKVRAERKESGRRGGLRAGAKPTPRPELYKTWVCSNCGARNRLFKVCVDCREPRGT